jgi:hypothetical protein
VVQVIPHQQARHKVITAEPVLVLTEQVAAEVLVQSVVQQHPVFPEQGVWE